MEDITPKKIALVVIGTLLTVSLLFGVWFLTSKTQSAPKQDISLNSTDHITGKKDSKVVLVEYSDFQCPACGQYYPMVKAVLDKYHTKIVFVQRHFPLDQHKNAIAAARAAEAAGKQKKFFAMGDLLFVNQTTWGESNNPQKYFTEYAKKLKLDMNQFNKDNTSAQDDTIQSDRNSGVALGVNSTPTFYLDGVKLNNPGSIEEFGKLIDKELTGQK